MKILHKLNGDRLGEDYDLVIGWGVARNEYEKKYNPLMYKLDYMIDGAGRCVGENICGHKVYSKEILKEITDKRILFIVYPNVEDEVTEAANQADIKEFDTIISSLIFLDQEIYVRSFSENFEDLIFFNAIKKLKINNPYYIDIGVWHPIIRNNTYLLYENKMTDGLLIEPNHKMCELIKAYRPYNKLVEGGACGGTSQILKYYVNEKGSFSGHNTFSYEEAKKLNILNNSIAMNVYNINELLEKYAERCPDIIDIDVEGMDKEIIMALDTSTFRAKIISIEETACGSMRKIMEHKGYVHFTSTRINGIYIAKELLFK